MLHIERQSYYDIITLVHQIPTDNWGKLSVFAHRILAEMPTFLPNPQCKMGENKLNLFGKNFTAYPIFTEVAALTDNENFVGGFMCVS